MGREVENEFFRNKKGEIQYCKKCEGCINECKQSFRCEIVACKKYKRKKRGTTPS